MLILFALVPEAFANVFAAAWMLAGDLLEGADASILSWTYTRIGAGSILGGIAGGLLAKGLSLALEPRFLVVSGAGVLLIAAEIIRRAHRRRPISAPHPSGPTEDELKEKKVSSPQTPTVLSLLKNRYVRKLIAISAVSAEAALYIDFQFYALATVTGHVDANFFANFYIVLNFASLVLLLMAARWIQSPSGWAVRCWYSPSPFWELPDLSCSAPRY